MAHREKPLQFVKVKGNMAQSGAPTSFFGGGYGPQGANISAKNTKYVTENLSFPLNVEGDPQEGHYIIFTIKEQNKAKLATAPRRQDMTTELVESRRAPGHVGPGVGRTLSPSTLADRQAYLAARSKRIREAEAADKQRIIGLTEERLKYLQNNPNS